jgi:hypothetical protein
MAVTVYWRDSWEAAKKEAAREKRPLVLELFMEG